MSFEKCLMCPKKHPLLGSLKLVKGRDDTKKHVEK